MDINIQIRANANYPILYKVHPENKIKNAQFHAYIKGATDQRAIDIDKACEWLERWFLDSKYYTPQEALDSLRKYMED